MYKNCQISRLEPTAVVRFPSCCFKPLINPSFFPRLSLVIFGHNIFSMERNAGPPPQLPNLEDGVICYRVFLPFAIDKPISTYEAAALPHRSREPCTGCYHSGEWTRFFFLTRLLVFLSSLLTHFEKGFWVWCS